MNAQHTPGPWFTFANDTCVGGPVGVLGNPSGAATAGIAHCGMALRTGAELQANARLIAAAPALLAALSGLVNASSEGGLFPDDYAAELNAARGAIEQATGSAA